MSPNNNNKPHITFLQKAAQICSIVSCAGVICGFLIGVLQVNARIAVIQHDLAAIVALKDQVTDDHVLLVKHEEQLGTHKEQLNTVFRKLFP